jgi:tRNA nucleotidyltransferase (CCA-adding enzyme)
MPLRPFVYLFKTFGLSSVEAPLTRTLARRAGQIGLFQHLPLRTYSASVPCRTSMRNPESDPDFSDRVRKRRRISSPTLEGSYPTMSPAMPTIELTPLESTLRTLLLDVAHYITEQKIPEGGSTAKDHSETVLRFTGGWVRDKLLGVDSHDIDVGISNMTGYQFGMALKDYLDVPEHLENYKKGLPNGEMHDAIVSLHKIEANPEKSKHLETVTTKIFGLDIDLVNLRKETYTDDSRNPQMEFGTAVEDALRRDATINALFYNLNESRLEDLTERGLDDMKKNIIRCPMEPYQTFKDDPLRVLRLIRFASRLGYQIEAETEAAMQIEDIREALKLKISKERVGTEVEKMLRGESLHLPDTLHF